MRIIFSYQYFSYRYFCEFEKISILALTPSSEKPESKKERTIHPDAKGLRIFFCRLQKLQSRKT